MAKQKTMWVAEDGTTFGNKVTAELYEYFIKYADFNDKAKIHDLALSITYHLNELKWIIDTFIQGT